MRIKNSKKLNTLMKVYRAGIHPYYADILKKSKSERAMLSKLRMSGHKLSIECCRYLNISKHERICTACNSGEVKNVHKFYRKCQNQRETALS